MLLYRTLILKNLVQYFDSLDNETLQTEEFMFFDEKQRLIEIHISGDGDMDYSIYADFEAMNNMETIDGGRFDIQTSPTSTAIFILDDLLK